VGSLFVDEESTVPAPCDNFLRQRSRYIVYYGYHVVGSSLYRIASGSKSSPWATAEGAQYHAFRTSPYFRSKRRDEIDCYSTWLPIKYPCYSIFLCLLHSAVAPLTPGATVPCSCFATAEDWHPSLARLRVLEPVHWLPGVTTYQSNDYATKYFR
jgi:hypothetical protein